MPCFAPVDFHSKTEATYHRGIAYYLCKIFRVNNSSYLMTFVNHYSCLLKKYLHLTLILKTIFSVFFYTPSGTISN